MEIILPISFRIYGFAGLIDYTVGVWVRISPFDNDSENERTMKKMTKRNKFKETTTHKIRFVATKHREEFFLLSFIGMSKLLMAKRAMTEYTELENAST